MTRAAIDLDQAKLDPAVSFHAPKDVLGAPGLSPEDKKVDPGSLGGRRRSFAQGDRGRHAAVRQSPQSGRAAARRA